MPRQSGFGTFVIGNVDQHVDGAGQSALVVEQWCGIWDERNARPIGAFRNGLHAVDWLLLRERNCHRALIVRQRCAVRPVKLPGTAELATSKLRAATPKSASSLVEEGDPANAALHKAATGKGV